MRRVVWFAGKKYYRIVPFIVIGYMLIIFAAALAGMTEAVSLSVAGKNPVVIDPGHGGYDPGAITSKGVYEKDINLAISKKVKTKLAESGIKAILTREDDRDYANGAGSKKTKKQTDLDYRIGLVEGLNPEILISIHVNSGGGNNSGAEAFYQEGSEEGKALAECVQAELRKIPGMTKRVAKSGEFYLTRNTKVTAIILELGYLSNPVERKKLLQNFYQDQLADAITAGIKNYLAGGK